MDKGQVHAREVEHHCFVHHGEFQVCSGVIDREPSVFDQCHIQETVGQDERQHQQIDRHVVELGEDGREGAVARHQRQGSEQQEEAGFDQHGEEHLTGRAHALEAAAALESCEHQHQFPKREQVGKEDKIPVKAHQRREYPQWNQQRGPQRRGEIESRRHLGQQRGRGAVNFPFAEQYADRKQRLEKGHARAPGQPCTGFVDNPFEAERPDQYQDEWNHSR